MSGDDYQDILDEWFREQGKETAYNVNEIDRTKTEEQAPENGSLYDLTIEAKRLRTRLSKQVYGQEHAITAFVSGYFQSQVTGRMDADRVKPGATFLFAGAPGVGKTFLAETAAGVLKLPFARFDMSEYSDKDSMLEFSGSDKVYKNGKEGNVTSFVKEHPHCVLLFDEIEKAHLNVIHLFLQMLDAGRLRDNYTDEEISFRNAIIIFTTNAGRQLYEGSQSRNLSGVSRKTIIRALQSDINPDTEAPLFPMAICSRFASGNVVMFNQMKSHHLKRIAGEKLAKSARNMEKSFQLKIDIDDDVSSALMFAEGGRADARTLSGRAESFFNEELFELFRQLAFYGDAEKMKRLKKVRFTVDLSDAEPEVRNLFRMKQAQNVLMFAGEQTVRQIEKKTDKYHILNAGSREEADRILKNEEITAVLIEPVLKEERSAGQYLNIEDIPSEYIDFYNDTRESQPDMPVYILKTKWTRLGHEEEISFLRTGARGICDVSGQSVEKIVSGICSRLYQQKAMDELARYNQVVVCGSGQKLSPDGSEAEISLINLELKYAVDAGDSEKILRDTARPDICFEDIIGAEDVKEELRFFADYLKHPRQYMKQGLRAPKGILLYGDPGTGKTMLAKAMAAEADMTFITAEGGQFLKKYLGEGAEAIHDLFRTARKYAPAILFIDEIDAIGRQRTGDDINNRASGVLNALLTEMDGFRNETSERVFVLAATNFEVSGQGEDSLDAALIRRFDRKILVELPNREQRQQFLQRRADANPALAVSESEIANLAVRSTGMSLALLDSVLEFSLRNALRMSADQVTDEMLEEAFETFNSGKEKKWNPDQLLRTARHEAGHAFVCWKSGEVPAYLTISARSGYGGYMQPENLEDKGIWTRQEILGRIRTALGGRAAEIVYYGPEDGLTTGAAGDLETATQLAEYMICRCGMDEEVGLAVIDRSDIAGSVLDETVRRKINKVLADELGHAINEIEEHRVVVDRLVEELIQETHIDGVRMQAIFEG